MTIGSGAMAWFSKYLFVIITMCLLPNIAEAGNPQYRCEPGTVDNDAVVIAPSDVDVGRFSDPNNKICTFSIGGASANGTSTRSIQTPIQHQIDALFEGDVSGIVIRLTQARTVFQGDYDDIHESIEEVFKKSHQELTTCFKALSLYAQSNQPDPLNGLENNEQMYLSTESASLHVWCSILAPERMTYLKSEVPTLHLRVRSSGGQDDSLFVPQGAYHGQY